MQANDTLKFQDNVRVELGVPELSREELARKRVEDSPLDKLLNNLNIQDPYANPSK